MATNSILSQTQNAIVADERQALESLLGTLEGWESRPEDTRRIREALQGLQELFLLVVTGEFNAGKSRLVNTLIGGRFLEEGVTPTTQQVQVLVHGDDDRIEARSGFATRSLPAEILRDMRIVDTPGTNAILREHEALTREFVPRADLVIFVTSADRPFSESERTFLAAIREWGKSIVFVINKIDLLESEADRAQVIGFVGGAATALLGEQPKIFALSARRALAALEAEDATALSASGWTDFRDWLMASLTAESRLRLKLENPLGVADKVLDEAEGDVARRLELLTADRIALEDVGRALDSYRAETLAALQPRFDRMDRQLMALRERGELFLEDRFRLLKLRRLLDGERLRRDFEDEVVAGSPDAIAREIDELIDWSVDREHAQWKAIRERLEAQNASQAMRAALSERDEGFAARRRALLDRVGSRAEVVVASFDPRAESARLAAAVQNTLAQAGLAEAGAIGLGLIIKATALTALDPTGIFAGALAVLGLSLIPYRRRQATTALRERVAGLRDDLQAMLDETMGREVETSAERMSEAIAPYGRFVRGEVAALEDLSGRLVTSRVSLDALRQGIARELGGRD